MRVMHVLNSNKYSGAENVVIQIMKHMPKNVETIYVSPKGKIENVLKEEKVKYYLLDKLSILNLRRTIKELKPDIIHAHDYTASMLCAIVTKKRVISHLHNNSPWIKKYGLKSWGYFLSSYRYSNILLVSESVDIEYVFSNRISSKYKVIGNPINVKEIQQKGNKVVKSETCEILFVGRLTEQKNPYLFVDVVKEVYKKKNDIKAYMVGEGELKTEIQNYVEEVGLKNNIELLGFQENPISIVKNAKMLLMTSSWEGYGLVAVEAMAMLKPVVCKNVGGLGKIVDNNCGYICETKEQLVNSCIELLENADKYAEKVAETKKKIVELDNIQDYMKVILQIYNNEIGEKYEDKSQ